MTSFSPSICLLDPAIQLSQQDLRQLAAHFQVVPWRSADAATLAVAQALLLHSRISPDEIKQLRRCQYIGVRAHNTDYVPQSVRRPGLLVQGIPQFGTQAVAEHTFALMFGLAKQLRAGHQRTVEQRWREDFPPNVALAGKTLGVIGYGKIGQCVAQMAHMFGLRVLIAAKPDQAPAPGQVPLETLLQQADIISLHTSTVAGQPPLLNQARLALLKPSALLINTARGALLDYQALGEMVQQNAIGGVGLDVYPSEPPQLAWLDHPRVLCSPHVAFHTDSTLAAMNGALLEQLLNWQQNRV